MEQIVTKSAIVRLVARMKEYVQNAVKNYVDAVSAQLESSIAEKADKSTTYTKTQVDNMVNAKANWSNVYDKTTMDTMLGTQLAKKANTTDVYTKDEVYTKEYINSTYAAAEDVQVSIDDVVSMVDTKTGANKAAIDSVLAKTVVLTGSYTGLDEVSVASLAQPVYVDNTKMFTLQKGDVLSTVLGYDTDIMVLNTSNELVARVTDASPYTHSSVTPINVRFGIDEVSGQTNAYSITKKLTITDVYKKIAELLTIK